jgi:uncharacterized protein YbjT (DUF2867 family)
MKNDDTRVLIVGATGYVGGRLLKRLESLGRPVRCLARRPAELRGRVGSGTEVVGGDVQDRESLANALAGIDTAYYLSLIKISQPTRRSGISV